MATELQEAQRPLIEAVCRYLSKAVRNYTFIVDPKKVTLEDLQTPGKVERMATNSAGITDEIYSLLNQPTENTLKELKRRQKEQIRNRFFEDTGMAASDSSQDEYIEWLEEQFIAMCEKNHRLEQDSVELSWLKNPERMGR